MITSNRHFNITDKVTREAIEQLVQNFIQQQNLITGLTTRVEELETDNTTLITKVNLLLSNAGLPLIR